MPRVWHLVRVTLPETLEELRERFSAVESDLEELRSTRDQLPKLKLR